jgi:hypothetical protein
MAERGETPETLGARLGWQVSDVLSNPEAMWAACNLDCLQDLCAAVGLNWLAVLSSWRGKRAA